MDFSVRPLQSRDIPACEKILRGLPRWFGMEEALLRYVRDLESLPALVAVDGPSVLGLLALRRHNPEAAEIHVMAVHRDHHRRGIGGALIEAAESGLNDVKLLEVKTLGPSHPDEGYKSTRRFYAALGFIPLEETTAFWGEDQPCLIMVKPLAHAERPAL